MVETKGLVKLKSPSKDLGSLVKEIEGLHNVPTIIVTDKKGYTAVGNLGRWSGPEGTYCLTKAIQLNSGSGHLTHAFGGDGSIYVFNVGDIAMAYQVK